MVTLAAPLALVLCAAPLGMSGRQGNQALAVITAAEWGTTLTVCSMVAGADQVTTGEGPAPAVLRWPTVLGLVPKYGGYLPSVQPSAFPVANGHELDWLSSFREAVGGGARYASPPAPKEGHSTGGEVRWRL